MIQGWIPVEQELPDEGVVVLINVPYASEPVWLGYLEDGRWYWESGVALDFAGLKATHWQPLPEEAKP